MQYYIVRVYREFKEKSPSFAGIVETVGSGKKKTFNTFAEFCEIFDPGSKRRKGESPPVNGTIGPRTERHGRPGQRVERKRRRLPA